MSTAPCSRPHPNCPCWGRRHGLLQIFSRLDPCEWLPAAAKLPPLPGHPYLNKNFVSGSQRVLCPVTPGTPGKSSRSLYQGLSIRDFLYQLPLYVIGGTQSSKSVHRRQRCRHASLPRPSEFLPIDSEPLKRFSPLIQCQLWKWGMQEEVLEHLLGPICIHFSDSA